MIVDRNWNRPLMLDGSSTSCPKALNAGKCGRPCAAVRPRFGASGNIAPSRRGCLWSSSSISTALVRRTTTSSSVSNCKACLIEIDVDRFTQAANGVLARVCFGRTGTRQFCAYGLRNLEDMIRVTKAVTGDMEFARVDLYSDGKSRIRNTARPHLRRGMQRISRISGSTSGSAVILTTAGSIAQAQPVTGLGAAERAQGA